MYILFTAPAYIYKREQWKHVHDKIINYEFGYVCVCVICMGTDLAKYVKTRSTKCQDSVN